MSCLPYLKKELNAAILRLETKIAHVEKSYTFSIETTHYYKKLPLDAIGTKEIFEIMCKIADSQTSQFLQRLNRLQDEKKKLSAELLRI